MEKIAISKFKATCLAVLERVRKTRKPVLVTRRGEPIAEVVPTSLSEQPAKFIGSRVGTIQIVGDIVSPVVDESEWEALQ